MTASVFREVSLGDGAGWAGSRSRARLVALSVAAALGAFLLAVVITTFWLAPGDNLAYWIAGWRLANGLPIYAPPEIAFEPFSYHYPPPLAQVLAPLSVVVPALAYCVAYRALLVLALWELAGRRMLPMLAIIAFVPVAIALRYENVEIFIALAIVVGLTRWPWLFSLTALMKASPGLGVLYLLLRRRWREAAIAIVVGAGVVAISYALAPELWPAWLEAISGRATMVGNSIVPVPFAVRAAAAVVLTVVAGVVGRRTGELLLVAAVTIGNPGLSLQSFSVLAACIPIWLAGPEGLAARRSQAQSPAGALRGDPEVSPA